MFQKSNKQRRAEIKAARLERARKNARDFVTTEPPVPRQALLADHDRLTHVCQLLQPLPLYYLDMPFVCRDCGAHEVWAARQQKWWYEEAKGHLDSTAIRCRPCRNVERERKAEARRVHQESLAGKGA